jgi:electron transfer flavoprotein alpha subunit
MKILVCIEQRDESIKAANNEIIKAATSLGSKGDTLAAVVVGKDAASLAGSLSAGDIGTVYTVSHESLTLYNPLNYADAVEAAVKQFSPDLVLGLASPMGRDLFPRLAARFDAGLLTDLTHIESAGDSVKGTKPLYAGKCLATVELAGSGLGFATIRPNSYPQEASEGAATQVTAIDFTSSQDKLVTKEIQKGVTQKADLTEASRIISGGRAMGSSDAFSILHECADQLNATVGASRAAVDSGYAPHAMQVGQTGKTVNPNLYIACGISGSIQHMAGMRTSKVIVAVNTDPDAPIFKVADYGIIGDLFEVVPELTKALQAKA